MGARSPQAMHITSRMVPWISTTRAGIAAGLLVQAVDVLGDEGVQLAPALEVDERAVARVGLGRPRRATRAGSATTRFRTSGSAM